jgi:hypothetical protein
MQRRSRSTKKLAQRIDLNYFKRLYPIPRWRRLLSFGAVALGLAWLGLGAIGGKQQAFNAGPLARSHKLFTQKCSVCHVVSAGFTKAVTNEACNSCHVGTIHQAKQKFTPACATCHVEHQGAFTLNIVRDQSCTQCHAASDAKTRVGSFDSAHPEFAPLRGPDPSSIKFGHAIHMKPGLRGSQGLVQLKCNDCHEASASGLMAPVTYQQHCASCHGLQFDERFSEPAPHQKPDIVVAYVTQRYSTYIAAHPEEVHRAEPADPRIMRPPRPGARDAKEWIEWRVTDAETLLWRKSCVECHVLNRDRAALPIVQESAIPRQWMKNAVFRHQAHQMSKCVDCHAKAEKSDKTADVLLPGIETCRTCHRDAADSAAAHCSECHLYHSRLVSAEHGAAHP